MQPIRTFSTLILLLTLVVASPNAVRQTVHFLSTDKTQKPQLFNTLILYNRLTKDLNTGQGPYPKVNLADLDKSKPIIIKPQPIHTPINLYFYQSNSEALFASNDLKLVEGFVKNLRKKGFKTHLESDLESKNSGIYETGHIAETGYHALKCDLHSMRLLADEYRETWGLSEPPGNPKKSFFSRFSPRLTKQGV